MDMEPPSMNLDVFPEGHRSGYVAIIGKPNVGKSTLMNHLLGRKLSIVTHKSQTTRHRILGILSGDDYQAIFLDTPGIIMEPRYRLHESMMHEVQDSIADADMLLFMADASQGRPDTFSLDFIGHRPALLLLNKMDLIRQEDALPLVEAYVGLRAFEEVIPVSALNGQNLDLVREETIKRLPLGPPFYPREMISEHPERFFVAEIIREKVFEQYRDEIPYSTTVNIAAYDEGGEGKQDRVSAEIIVERESQKGIVIGKKGSALKQVGIAARKDIEAFLQKSIYLELFVKVRPDWRNRDNFLRSFGYRT